MLHCLDTYIVLCNFNPSVVYNLKFSGLNLLSLWVGERVKVVHQHNNWCYGFVLKENNRIGLFPTNHIQRIGNGKTFRDENDEAGHLIMEITETLKTWWKYVKEYYVNTEYSDQKNNNFIQLLKDLMIIRNKINSGNVPAGDMGLNMHIRDESGKIFWAKDLSIIRAYREHEAAYKKIIQTDTFISQSCEKFGLLISLNTNIDFKLHYDLEFIMQIMNTKTREIISESLHLFWSKKLKKLIHDACKALFVEITEKELREDTIALNVIMFKHGPIEINSNAINSNKKTECLTSTVYEVKQSYAKGLLNISDGIRDIRDKEKRELLFNLIRVSLGEKYPSNNYKNGLKEVTTYEKKIPITATIQLLFGNLRQIQEQNSEIFTCNPPALLQRLNHDNIKYTLDFKRNEFYIRLRQADLHGGKNAEKNIEAVFSVLDSKGNLLKNAIEIITPNKLVYNDYYKSCIIVNTDRPKFHEIVKFNLPTVITKNLHLRILFYDRGEKKNDKGPFALSFVRIIHNYILQNNEKDELLVYKIETGKFNVQDVSYLQYSGKRQENRLNQKNTNRVDYLSATIYQLNEKNTVHFSSCISSAIHTNNLRLLNIFFWRENKALLKERLKNFIETDDSADELLKFLPNFLDVLWEIANYSSEYHLEVFHTVVYVIRLCEEPKYQQFGELLENYIDSFYSTTAHHFLLKYLIWYITNEGSASKSDTRDRLLIVLKSMGVLIRMIIMSRKCAFVINKNIKFEENNAEMDNLLYALTKLIHLDSNRATCQNAALKYLPKIITPLIKFHFYKPIQLAVFIIDLLEKMSKQILVTHKLVFLSELINTDLFGCKKELDECRKLLLPKVLQEILFFIPPHTKISTTNTDFALENVQMSANILLDIMEKLFPKSNTKQRASTEELELILFQCFRPVNQTVVLLLNDMHHNRTLHALLLAFLDKFSAFHYVCYFNMLNTIIDKLDMLSKFI